MTQLTQQLLFTALVAIIASGCLSIEIAPVTPLPTPTSLASPTQLPSPPSASPPSTDRPQVSPTPSAASTPTTAPFADAGPPFPPRSSAVVYDYANVLSDDTERRATDAIRDLETLEGLSVVVFTQFNPGSDFDSTNRDAGALMDAWGINDSLAIFTNTTRLQCLSGAGGNGQLVMLRGRLLEKANPTTNDLRGVFDDYMLPLLASCKEDDALLAGLDRIRDLVASPVASATPPASSSDACRDPAYALTENRRWTGAYEWYFQASSTPARYQADDVLNILMASVATIVNASNDCGLPDNVSATATYMGVTTEAPCGEGGEYGKNVIGFGDRGGTGRDTIAYTCPYTDTVTGEYIEADIVINSEVRWALSADECSGKEELLLPTITHEFGHVFGLGHVSERRHGDLTMSTQSNGPCTQEEASLGLGDILGLEELY